MGCRPQAVILSINLALWLSRLKNFHVERGLRRPSRRLLKEPFEPEWQNCPLRLELDPYLLIFLLGFLQIAASLLCRGDSFNQNQQISSYGINFEC
jgi:hypothetical protein